MGTILKFVICLVLAIGVVATCFWLWPERDHGAPNEDKGTTESGQQNREARNRMLALLENRPFLQADSSLDDLRQYVQWHNRVGQCHSDIIREPFDQDGVEGIDPDKMEEWTAFRHELLNKAREDGFACLLGSCDSNSDGMLSRDEIAVPLSLLKRRIGVVKAWDRREHAEWMCWQRDHLDANGDGWVSPEENLVTKTLIAIADDDFAPLSKAAFTKR